MSASGSARFSAELRQGIKMGTALRYVVQFTVKNGHKIVMVVTDEEVRTIAVDLVGRAGRVWAGVGDSPASARA